MKEYKRPIKIKILHESALNEQEEEDNTPLPSARTIVDAIKDSEGTKSFYSVFWRLNQLMIAEGDPGRADATTAIGVSHGESPGHTKGSCWDVTLQHKLGVAGLFGGTIVAWTAANWIFLSNKGLRGWSGMKAAVNLAKRAWGKLKGAPWITPLEAKLTADVKATQRQLDLDFEEKRLRGRAKKVGRWYFSLQSAQLAFVIALLGGTWAYRKFFGSPEPTKDITAEGKGIFEYLTETLGWAKVLGLKMAAELVPVNTHSNEEVTDSPCFYTNLLVSALLTAVVYRFTPLGRIMGRDVRRINHLKLTKALVKQASKSVKSLHRAAGEIIDGLRTTIKKAYSARIGEHGDEICDAYMDYLTRDVLRRTVDSAKGAGAKQKIDDFVGYLKTLEPPLNDVQRVAVIEMMKETNNLVGAATKKLAINFANASGKKGVKVKSALAKDTKGWKKWFGGALKTLLDNTGMGKMSKWFRRPKTDSAGRVVPALPTATASEVILTGASHGTHAVDDVVKATQYLRGANDDFALFVTGIDRQAKNVARGQQSPEVISTIFDDIAHAARGSVDDITDLAQIKAIAQRARDAGPGHEQQFQLFLTLIRQANKAAPAQLQAMIKALARKLNINLDDFAAVAGGSARRVSLTADEAAEAITQALLNRSLSAAEAAGSVSKAAAKELEKLVKNFERILNPRSKAPLYWGAFLATGGMLAVYYNDLSKEKDMKGIKSSTESWVGSGLLGEKAATYLNSLEGKHHTREYVNNFKQSFSGNARSARKSIQRILADSVFMTLEYYNGENDQGPQITDFVKWYKAGEKVYDDDEEGMNGALMWLYFRALIGRKMDVEQAIGRWASIRERQLRDYATRPDNKFTLNNRGLIQIKDWSRREEDLQTTMFIEMFLNIPSFKVRLGKFLESDKGTTDQDLKVLRTVFAVHDADVTAVWKKLKPGGKIDKSLPKTIARKPAVAVVTGGKMQDTQEIQDNLLNLRARILRINRSIHLLEEDLRGFRAKVDDEAESTPAKNIARGNVDATKLDIAALKAKKKAAEAEIRELEEKLKQKPSAPNENKIKKGSNSVLKQNIARREELSKYVKEVLNENYGSTGYAPYPYHSGMGDDDEATEDFIQDWKAFELALVRDQSRDTAIQIAKILVRDLELFADVIDLVGKNQSVATEILKSVRKEEEKT